MDTTETDRAGRATGAKRSSVSISRGLEQLVHDLAERSTVPGADFDVVIVGSGYGGAIAAAELAGCTGQNGKAVSVCVLERGREYLPGMFPSRMADLAGDLRCNTPASPLAMGRREGLFDVRVGPDVCALVGNGLGGGSLINAGVMERPADTVFARWPDPFHDPRALDGAFESAKQMLGATVLQNGAAVPNTILLHPDGPPLKYRALEAMSAGAGQNSGFSAAAISVAMSDKPTQAGVELSRCIQCGDCMTGCNFNAKESLDTNLLARAWRAGADIVTGATVHRISRGCDDTWSLDVYYTDEKLRRRQGAAIRINAAKVILAAGTFGTTEILLRSKSDDLKFSRTLGQRFSSNGDSIFVAYDQEQDVNAVADEQTAPATRHVGPTITGMIDRRSDGGLVVQELAVPAPLRRLLEETCATAWTLHELEHNDDAPHGPGDDPPIDPCAINHGAMRKTSVLALLGDDGAEGAIELVGGDDETHGDGAVCVRWPELRNKPLFAAQQALLETLAEKSIRGRVLPNPLWRLLPENMEFLLDGSRGPLLTVHPLGGCPMGSNVLDGVVDDCGRVFDASPAPRPARWHEGLVVLDGSIIPDALGINPGLTIAAVALRAIKVLKANDWKYGAPGAPSRPVPPRPVFRDARPARPAKSTKIEIIERLSGKATLTYGSRSIPCAVELTLRFRPKSISALMGPMRRTLDIDTDESRLRIFREGRWAALTRLNASDTKLDAAAVLSATLSGTLDILHREKSSSDERRKRARCAWFWNRGARDTWQWIVDLWKKKGFAALIDPAVRAEVQQRARGATALATRAGEVRLFEYNLKIGNPLVLRKGDFPVSPSEFAGQEIYGTKRLTYSRRGNPWRQLKEMRLERFPGLGTQKPVLSLDTKYLARKRVALLRLTDQEDQAAALVDLVAFGLYLLRLMLNIHIWSFRRPDAAEVGEPQRLPGVTAGLPSPKVKELQVDQLPNGLPVRVRITRYPNYRSKTPPVVMIHGYSAGGNTFAHHSLRPSLAEYLYERGRDIWVLDLRTSSGMPTARYPWSFEDAALADIPAAFEHILRETKDERKVSDVKLDVVAHCMGAAMLSMAVLGPPKTGERFFRQREELPLRINRIVLSQVGPVVVFSPDNIFRAYVMSYLRYFLPFANYDFMVGPDPSLADQLIDRLLATLPYPEEEFDIENPPYAFWRRTPFVGTRHRMDALYGRDFSLKNVDRSVLKHIDDLFGPMSIETVSQAIHFARLQQVTNRRGRNAFISRANFAARWNQPTFSVHGEDNGLVDVATLARMKRTLRRDSRLNYTSHKFLQLGHQDSLIGRDANVVFEKIFEFLDSPPPPDPPPLKDAEPNAPEKMLLAEVPAQGPVIGPLFEEDGKFLAPVGAGANPAMGHAVLAAFVPVVRCGEKNENFCMFWEPTAGSAGTAPPPGWFMFVPNDPDGWVRLNLNAADWPAGAEGVLMILLYNQPGALTKIAYEMEKSDPRKVAQLATSPIPFIALQSSTDDPKLASEPLMGDPKLSYLETFPLPVLVGFLKEIRQQFYGAIELLLEQNNASSLESGVIQVSRAKKLARVGLPPQEAITTTFALGSCHYPTGMVDDALAHASYERLAQRFNPVVPPAKLPPPDLLLLVGDQIYADATAGLFDPASLEDRYRRPYEKLFSIKSVQSIVRQVPTYMMLDDHEIDDNWEPGADDVRVDPRLKAGRKAYWKFQRRDRRTEPTAIGDSVYPLWDDQFSADGFPFFITDTRTEREARCAGDIAAAYIMSETQFEALLKWLSAQDRDVPKFVVSACTLLPRKLEAIAHEHVAGGLRSDSWQGFPYSFHRLLAEIAQKEIRNVVFLSGDEHLSFVARAELRRQGAAEPVVVHSVHSSALYAPFPFANAIREDFADDDQFSFDDPSDDTARYECVVSTTFADAGDGFTVLRVRQETGHWVLDVEYDRADGSKVQPYQLS